MEPHQQRVVDELEELNVKRNKLLAFLQTNMFDSLDAAERARLRMQLEVMGIYASILKARIEAFPV